MEAELVTGWVGGVNGGRVNKGVGGKAVHNLLGNFWATLFSHFGQLFQFRATSFFFLGQYHKLKTNQTGILSARRFFFRLQYRFVNSTQLMHVVECGALVCLWLLKRRFRWLARVELFKLKMAEIMLE